MNSIMRDDAQLTLVKETNFIMRDDAQLTLVKETVTKISL